MNFITGTSKYPVSPALYEHVKLTSLKYHSIAQHDGWDPALSNAFFFRLGFSVSLLLLTLPIYSSFLSYVLAWQSPAGKSPTILFFEGGRDAQTLDLLRIDLTLPWTDHRSENGTCSNINNVIEGVYFVRKYFQLVLRSPCRFIDRFDVFKFYIDWYRYLTAFNWFL